MYRLNSMGEMACILGKSLFSFRSQGHQEGSYTYATVSHL